MAKATNTDFFRGKLNDLKARQQTLATRIQRNENMDRPDFNTALLAELDLLNWRIAVVEEMLEAEEINER